MKFQNHQFLYWIANLEAHWPPAHSQAFILSQSQVKSEALRFYDVFAMLHLKHLPTAVFFSTESHYFTINTKKNRPLVLRQENTKASFVYYF